MAFTPENAAIRMTPEMEKALATANADEIKELMTQAAVEQGLATRDHYSPDVLLPTELASAAPRKFAKSVTVNGQKQIFEGDSELEVERAIGDYFRSLQGAQETNPARQQHQTEPPRDASTGRFVSAEDAAAKADLELAFKRGDISASDYLQQSGALADYLEKAGVPLEELKKAVQEKRDEQSASSWADATETFKSRHPEWVGGSANRDTVGRILAEHNLVDAEDKVGALEAAYNHARENGLLVDNPELITRQKVSEATSVEEIRQAVGYRNTTGMWGR